MRSFIGGKTYESQVVQFSLPGSLEGKAFVQEQVLDIIYRSILTFSKNLYKELHLDNFYECKQFILFFILFLFFLLYIYLFWRQCLLRQPRLYRIQYGAQIQLMAGSCFSLPSAGIIGVSHYTQHYSNLHICESNFVLITQL